MGYTRRGRIVVSWMALPAPNTLPDCPHKDVLPGPSDEPLELETFDTFIEDLGADGLASCTYHGYDARLIAWITVRAHRGGRRLTDELIELIAAAEGAPPAETELAKSLLDRPIRYSRSTRLYTSRAEWACAMRAAKAPAIVVEQAP